MSRASRVCLATLVLIIVAWALLPAIPQDQTYHGFADQRSLLGVPNAADVLSNISFALVGVFGAVGLVSHRRERYSPATEAGLWCTTLGLVCVAVGSAWFHIHPTDATLFWDRLPMTLVFAGILGAAIAQRVGNSEGRIAVLLLVPLGIASVVYWKMTGDLSPYATLQFGGVGGLLALLALTRRSTDPFPWRWVVAWYVFAKIAEHLDHQIWEATHGVIAGHAIKHLLAATAGAAALWPCIIANSAKQGASPARP